MSESETTLEAVERRLASMDLQPEALPGGRSLLARMRLQRRMFETGSTPIRIDEVVFATVGADRAKCLQPRALFQLPLLRIIDCRDATALEARIHLAWQRHLAQLAPLEQWLRALAVNYRLEEGRSLAAFSLSGEPREARARMIDRHRVILPGRGPLSRVALLRADDRVLPVDPQVESSLDLEIQISNRLEELLRLDSRLAQQRRIEALEDTRQSAPRPAQDRRPTVLAVGPRIMHEHSCLESLRVRGYQVEAVPGEREAIATFDHCSPELVLADVKLGRSEGIDLIQSLRQVPGVEEVPVILIDSHKREDRREAARRMGAAGYLVYPIDVSRIDLRLARIVSEPRRRRFTRYHQRLPVRVQGAAQPLLTDSIGRGGMFLATDEEMATNSLRDCQLRLPELGTQIRVEAEVLYRARAASSARPGVGLRFNAFPDADEPVFIEYLRNLHPRTPVPAI